MPQLPTAHVKPGYQPQSPDTSIDADVLMFSLLRQLSPQAKAKRLQALDCSLRKLHPKTQMIEDPITVALGISCILDSLTITYYVEGSLSSSLHGEPRYSEDLDLVLALDQAQVPRLIEILSPQFYVSETAISEALVGAATGKTSSFNIISLASAEKIDLFVSRNSDFARSQMERRMQYPLEQGSLWICSPEDIILQKLLWAPNLEKQQRDVLGVMKLQQQKLDFDYLWHWATELGVPEALSAAFEKAGF